MMACNISADMTSPVRGHGRTEESMEHVLGLSSVETVCQPHATASGGVDFNGSSRQRAGMRSKTCLPNGDRFPACVQQRRLDQFSNLAESLIDSWKDTVFSRGAYRSTPQARDNAQRDAPASQQHDVALYSFPYSHPRPYSAVSLLIVWSSLTCSRKMNVS